MEMRLTIAIDDVNPKRGYRILGEQTEKWLRSLNEEFGARFTLFIPSNYHKTNSLSENSEWLRELNSIEWLECAAHGHFHMTSDPTRMGECEMIELDSIQKSKSRFDMMMEEWDACGVKPVGWRNPGWLCHPAWNQFVNNNENPVFDYVAVHYDHNRDMNWGCKTFFGHDGIQVTNIGIHNDDMIMYQSHIAGTHNHNVWNQENYEQLQLSLSHIFDSVTVTPKLLRECV